MHPPKLEPPSVAPSSRLNVRLTADGMSAFASVSAGPREGAVELDDYLHAAGIVHGVDETARAALLEALASEEALATELEIARGFPAGNGRAGRFEPAFRPGLQAGHVREDGTIDFRDRELLKPISIGETLGHLYPPVEGEPGRRVDGTLVAAEPAPPFELRVGLGAELLAGGQVRAACSGVIIYVEGRSIEVGTHYVHEADVDLRSGDLFMEGSLMVRSDVQRGFVVRTTGDLEIRGGVEGGSAYAGANLLIHGGVRGSEGSMVAAGGDLQARHVERARLDCGGLLEVSDAVNSELSGVQIRIARSLRGGRAAAETSLVTQDVGTASGNAETSVETAVPREHPEEDARNALEAAKLHRVAARRELGPRGGVADRGKGGKLARELAGAQRGALARKIERAIRMQALSRHAFIDVRGTAHAGVHIRIGEVRLQLQDAMRNVRFTLDFERGTIRTEVVSR